MELNVLPSEVEKNKAEPSEPDKSHDITALVKTLQKKSKVTPKEVKKVQAVNVANKFKQMKEVPSFDQFQS